MGSNDELSPLSQTVLQLVMAPKGQRKAIFRRSFSELAGAFLELGGRHIREVGREDLEDDASVIDAEGIERK
jgi:hypothetical protein